MQGKQQLELMEQGVRQALSIIVANPTQTMTPFALLVDNGEVIHLTSRRNPADALDFFRSNIRPRSGTTFYVLIWEGMMGEFYPNLPAASKERAIFAEMSDDKMPNANVMAYCFAIKEPGIFRSKREITIKSNKLIYAATPSRIFPTT
jgi:hypothetical protein